jgi:hypothetical protein
VTTTYETADAEVLSGEPLAVTGTEGEQHRDLLRHRDGQQHREEEWPVLSPVPAALGHIAHGMYALGLPREVSDDLLSLLACAAAHLPTTLSTRDESAAAPSASSDAPASSGASASACPSASSDADVSSASPASVRFPVAAEDSITHTELLDAASAVRRVQGFAESVAVAASRSLAQRAGLMLLKERRVSLPDELSATARARWRAKTKSVVAHELSVLTGHSLWRCRSLVAFAEAPRVAAAPVEEALRVGATDWRAVELWWSRCRAMPVDDAAEVAEAVFGPLLSEPVPDEPAAGRTTGTSLRTESWGEFKRRLEREVVRVQGADPEAARARRRAAVEARNVGVEICDDGLGSISITGPTAAVVGAADRLETIARKARAAGDERPLNQIRADSALALLVHGVLPLPRATATMPDQDDLDPPLAAAPDDVLRIIKGLPAMTVELILPLSALNPVFHPDGCGDTGVACRNPGEGQEVGRDHDAGGGQEVGRDHDAGGSRQGGRRAKMRQSARRRGRDPRTRLHHPRACSRPRPHARHHPAPAADRSGGRAGARAVDHVLPARPAHGRPGASCGPVLPSAGLPGACGQVRPRP